MYKLQEQPDKKAVTKSGTTIKPVATLKDEHGGISHIAFDDGCYVLYNGSEGRPFGISSHWYKEAVEALQTLSPPNKQAEREHYAA
jgi:hypothetical protein